MWRLLGVLGEQVLSAETFLASGGLRISRWESEDWSAVSGLAAAAAAAAESVHAEESL